MTAEIEDEGFNPDQQNTVIKEVAIYNSNMGIEKANSSEETSLMDNSDDTSQEITLIKDLENNVMQAKGRYHTKSSSYWEHEELRQVQSDAPGRASDGTDPPGQQSVYIPPGDNQHEIYRLSTYEHFPVTCPVSRKYLAKAGFYFTGFFDRVKCFACERTVERWEETDNPADLKWHKPDCPFPRGEDCGNVPVRSLFGGIDFPRTSTSGSSRSNQQVLQQTDPNTGEHRIVRFPADLPERIRQQDGTFRIGPSHSVHIQSGPSSTRGRLPGTQQAPMPPTEWRMANVISADHRRFLTNLFLNRELDRVASFARWPVGRPNVSPAALARSGFFYLGDMDRTQCFSCGGVLRNWTLDDDAQAEHRSHFPACPMVLGTEQRNIRVPNVPDTPDERSRNFSCRSSSNRLIRNSTVEEVTTYRQSPGEKRKTIAQKTAQAKILFGTKSRHAEEPENSFLLQKKSKQTEDSRTCKIPLTYPTDDVFDPCRSLPDSLMMNATAKKNIFDRGWPKGRTTAMSQDTKAGFINLGKRGCVKYWYCNRGLQNCNASRNSCNLALLNKARKDGSLLEEANYEQKWSGITAKESRLSQSVKKSDLEVNDVDFLYQINELSSMKKDYGDIIEEETVTINEGTIPSLGTACIASSQNDVGDDESSDEDGDSPDDGENDEPEEEIPAGPPPAAALTNAQTQNPVQGAVDGSVEVNQNMEETVDIPGEERLPVQGAVDGSVEVNQNMEETVDIPGEERLPVERAEDPNSRLGENADGLGEVGNEAANIPGPDEVQQLEVQFVGHVEENPQVEARPMNYVTAPESDLLIDPDSDIYVHPEITKEETEEQAWLTEHAFVEPDYCCVCRRRITANNRQNRTECCQCPGLFCDICENRFHQHGEWD